jgi:response regulator RpfG family c-di-GMP phosphodiesterase
VSEGEDRGDSNALNDTLVDGDVSDTLRAQVGLESSSAATLEFDDLVEATTGVQDVGELLGRAAYGDLYVEGNPESATWTDTVLLVDDEPFVLKALGRLLRSLAVEVITAEDALEALDIMERQEVSVLLSDEFMPGMSGTELLELVRERHPMTVRIMLTGNDDLSTAVAAINRGDVFRFLNKPWENEELLQCVKIGLEQYGLKKRAKRYELMIERQNEHLQELNLELERRVKERTVELRESRAHIQELYSELQQSFDGTLSVMLSMMELGERDVVDHCRRTAARVEAFAQVLGLSRRVIEPLRRAAQLHWIGLINVPSTFLDKEPRDFGMEEEAIWEFHPLLGYQVLESIDELRRPGQIVLHYMRDYTDERFARGQAVEGLEGPLDDAFILSCRILGICSAFEYVRTTLRRRGERSERVFIDRGLDEIKRGKGTRFAPELVDPFVSSIKEAMAHVRSENEVERVEKLRSGMVLSRPLFTRQGVAVAPRDLMLTQEFIDRLMLFESTGGLTSIFVWSE